MATDNSIEKTKLCVCRGVMDRDSGRVATGVFRWTGKNWRTATIAGLVKALPASISDADLQREYRAAVQGGV